MDRQCDKIKIRWGVKRVDKNSEKVFWKVVDKLKDLWYYNRVAAVSNNKQYLDK